jgi:propanol-preferring alcohol dehydrogenase
VPIGGIGLGADGGMAEYLIAQARQLLPIPDLELSQAAPLTDAGLTPYHAIAQVRQALAPGSTCVVIGVGGLGHMAVQILAATTATRIVAVDLRADALRFAHEHGAHVTLPSNADTAKHIRDLVGPMPGGADVVLDFVGAPPTVDLARAVVSTGGHISVVGLGGGALPVGYGTIPFEVTVHLPFWGTRLELAEVMALARAGRLRAQVQEFSLDHAATAYDALRSGQIAGRAVVVPAR